MEENNTKKYCPRCGPINEIYASYCSNYGQKLSDSHKQYEEIFSQSLALCYLF